MKKKSFIVLIAVSLVILFAGSYSPETSETTTISVSGMRCDRCVTKIQSALIEAEGVKGATVCLASGSAEVVFSPAVVSIEDIKGVVIKAGFCADSKADKASCSITKSAGAACSVKKSNKSKKSI